MTPALRQALTAVHFESRMPRNLLVLTVEFSQEDDRWLAECLELGTAAYGRSLEEARAEVLEAVSLQLNQVEQLGFMQEFLRDHGVRPLPLRPPKGQGTGKATWAVPELALDKTG